MGKAVDARKPVTDADLDARFWAKVNMAGGQGPAGDCWEWTAKVLPSGRGRYWHDGRWCYPYRLTLEAAAGPPPTALHYAGHTVCDNPRCVNPAHLAWQTPGENSQEMMAKGRAGGVAVCPNARMRGLIASAVARRRRRDEREAKTQDAVVAILGRSG